jgi:hypothetical protein
MCDACHHEIDIPVITKAHIGLPCPVCESCMITAADYRGWRRLMFWRAVHNALRWLFRGDERYSVSIIEGRIKFWDGR